MQYVRWGLIGYGVLVALSTLPFVGHIVVERYRLWREERRFRKELKRL